MTEPTDEEREQWSRARARYAAILWRLLDCKKMTEEEQQAVWTLSKYIRRQYEALQTKKDAPPVGDNA